MSSPTTTTALLAAALALFSSALAFSPDQCNVTSYGAPARAACNTLLATISKSGAGNTSYLFIPSEFSTPEGWPNGTRRNFPQKWSNTGCRAALVPINVTTTQVTYDTSSYADIASAGQAVVKNCISNSTSSGGWELAGDNEDLVLHIYAAGSPIDDTINSQTGTQIAATSEDDINVAEMDDPAYSSDDSGLYPGDISSYQDPVSSSMVSTPATTGPATSTPVAAIVTTAASASVSASASVPAVAASVFRGPGTFDYFGCVLDSSSSRTLTSLSWAGTGLTVERCAAYCLTYQYMGVEFGSECYCGGDANGKGVKSTTIVLNEPNNCTMPCNGDPTQLCGGSGWMNYYQNRNSATAGQTA